MTTAGLGDAVSAIQGVCIERIQTCVRSLCMVFPGRAAYRVSPARLTWVEKLCRGVCGDPGIRLRSSAERSCLTFETPFEVRDSGYCVRRRALCLHLSLGQPVVMPPSQGALPVDVVTFMNWRDRLGRCTRARFSDSPVTALKQFRREVRRMRLPLPSGKAESPCR